MSVILYRRKENGEIEAKAFDPFTFADRITEDWHIAPPEDEVKTPDPEESKAVQPEESKPKRTRRPRKVKHDNQG